MLIEISWLSDNYDCDQDGCSGGYSEGARVTVNGKQLLNLMPVAACFGGPSWDKNEVWAMILNELVGNVTVEEHYD